MPTIFAASISSIPFGASTPRPSMVRLTVSVPCVIVRRHLAPPSRHRRYAGHRQCLRKTGRSYLPWLKGTSLLGDVLFVLFAVLLHRGDHGRGGEVAQGTQHFAAYLT